MGRAAVAFPRAPRQQPVELIIDEAGAGESRALEINGAHHDLPALIAFTDHHRLRHAHIVEMNGVMRPASEGRDIRSHVTPGAFHVHDEHR